MMDVRPTYRLAALVLVGLLALTGTGPLTEHLCLRMGLMAPAAPHAAASHGSDAAGDAEDRDEAPCHPPPTDAEDDAPPASMACCTFTPAASAEAVVPAVPDAPRVAEDLLAAARPSAPRASLAHRRPAPVDTGPAPPPVRPHLAFSVFLI